MDTRKGCNSGYMDKNRIIEVRIGGANDGGYFRNAMDENY